MTTTTTTTLALAKAALKDLWVAALAASGDTAVQVTYGRRVTVSGAERVTIGGAGGETVPQSLGPARQMRENYDIRCGVSVSSNGAAADQQVVSERCIYLYGVLEHALRMLPSEDLGLTGATVLAVVQGSWEFGESDASETGGPLNAYYEFPVRISARFRN